MVSVPSTKASGRNSRGLTRSFQCNAGSWSRIATLAPGDPSKAKERPPASTTRSLPTLRVRSSRCASSIVSYAEADCASLDAGPRPFLPAGRAFGSGRPGFGVIFVAKTQRVDAFSLHGSFFGRLGDVGGNHH